LLLKTKLEETNQHHQAIIDFKLAKLSSVLDEIKTKDEELNKYKNLLRSLSSSIPCSQWNVHLL